MERYTTGTGQRILVHTRTPECDNGCVIHNPTSQNSDWPTHWREDRKIMERICPCGVGHPDPDGLRFIERMYGRLRMELEAIHGCCGHNCSV